MTSLSISSWVSSLTLFLFIYLIVSDFMSLSVSSRIVDCSILRSFVRRSSVVGSLESSMLIVFGSIWRRFEVFQFGTLVVREWSSSFSFIHSNRSVLVGWAAEDAFTSLALCDVKGDGEAEQVIS